MALDLLSGLAQGYAQAQNKKLERLQGEEVKKLQIKMFKAQLEQQEQSKSALGQVGKFLTGSPEIPPEPDLTGQAIGPPQPAVPGKTLSEMLSDPEGQLALLQSGQLGDVSKFAEQQAQAKQMESLTNLLQGQGQPTGGGGLPGGLQLSGIDIKGGKPSLSLERAKVTSEFIPSGDGKTMVQYDEFGGIAAQRPIRKDEIPISKGQASIDTAFAKEVADFNLAGGFADVEKQLVQLDSVVEALGKQSNLTGPLLGSIPDIIKPIIAPSAANTQELVEEVVQRNLRLVLGAQFTEKEGERLIARAYNPRLDESINRERVARLATQIRTAAQAKKEAVNYFMENGTLDGFQGKTWTMADFNPESGAGLPQGIPAGSKQIGTSNGVPVYETPEGKRLIVE